ncbi:hypothetical protein BSZ39_06135 [Bowdeniella nasicola]|uniref:Ketoreductase domain-containing protein n=1 Tax=Bowdeniella nasicola TaxID=208480 RepID=A0A1Q5Q2S3_9ACTO|nr:SDR family NAD(P)-dependent oxidoreductase [Bowdeniella nasicola]OKL54035.1 hypothetical protein BSZ39_06135 [Bowdeniella nasicola]
MTALVTGAASEHGIGFAIAKRFAARGHDLVLVDLSADITERASEIEREFGVSAAGHTCDLTDPDAVAELLAKLDEIDILVNNAGIASPTRIADIELSEWRRLFDVNLTGMFLLTQALGVRMRAAGGGRIVNMSSISAQQGGGNFAGAHYAASKAAIIGFTKAVARELAPDGVAVNAIAPGLIDTDITSGVLREAEATGETRLVAGIPSGRAGTPDEVAGAAEYLCCDAGFVVGQVISVNGGAYLP